MRLLKAFFFAIFGVVIGLWYLMIGGMISQYHANPPLFDLFVVFVVPFVTWVMLGVHWFGRKDMPAGTGQASGRVS
jgi:hypothetical protein